MGFALWVDGELAWSEGRHEYQPMGRAVIARTDLFRDRDFRRSHQFLSDRLPGYVGLFASLGEVNAYLASRREQAPGSHGPRSCPSRRSRSGRQREFDACHSLTLTKDD